MDLISEVLRLSGFRGTLGPWIAAGSGWSIELSDSPAMAVHAVLAGPVWLSHVDGRQSELSAGDVVLLPAGVSHRLGDALGSANPAHQVHASASSPEPGHGPLRLGNGAVRSRLLTIFYDCDHSTRTQVLDEVPGVVYIPGGEVGGAHLGDIVNLMERELSRPQLGTPTIVDSLVEIVLIQLVRAWSALNPTQQRGTWLGWVEDPLVREAIERIHADPAAEWTVDSLASAASVSRATLSRRFQSSMARSPARYLAQWRMDLAAIRLRDTAETVEDISAQVGYRSVPSFTRAFARDRGCSPGAYRAQVRADRALEPRAPGRRL
ncbi:AraC family transcriptional regulator [Streptomyces sp. A1136]|uniref:AraC family transcriptional regulator n=1 Tax=Streptomyces sp. A1136 TaxID=2563102 RepID=UPI001F104189|nr:AraC family transcriptional regulator [Streptomyces sp. A1136]